MLVIRLSRTGRKNQATYRLVVAEKSAPVQGRNVEILGSYNPAENKKFVFDGDRIKYWISQGAKPTDTVASLLKAKGVEGMDEYIGRRDIKRRKKNAPEEEEMPEAPAAEAAPAEDAPAEAPAEEPAAEEAAA